MKTKWYDTYFLQVALYVIGVLLVVFFLSGCKTKYVPMEKIEYRNVVKHDTLHTYDSVFVRDSIYLIQKGDTCYLDRWHEKTIFKNVYKVKVDSFLKRDSIPVPYPVEKELSKWEQFQLKYAVWSFDLLCMLLIILCYKLYKKIKNGRFHIDNQEK